MVEIEEIRNQILILKKNFFLKLERFKYKTEKSSLLTFRYLIFSTNNNFGKKNIHQEIKYINFKEQLKNYFFLRKFSSIKFYGEKNIKNLKKFKKIYFSWSSLQNFDSKGNYTDPYFKITNQKKNVLWILINSGEKIPKKIQDNIIIINPENEGVLFGFFRIFQYFFSLLVSHKFNFYEIINYISYNSFLANKVELFFQKNKIFKKIKKLDIPLESQVFQNTIIKMAKKEKVYVTGFDHTLNPFPFYNMYNKLSPSILNVHSDCSKKFYEKYLGWPKNKIIKNSSVRIERRKKTFFNNKIFLPIGINNPEFVFKKIDYIFDNYLAKENLGPFKVCLHPATIGEKKYKNLYERLSNLQKKYTKKSKKKNQKSISLHIGNLSTVLEALESGSEVYHLTLSKAFDLLSPKFWYSLDCTEIEEDIFRYKLKKFGHCVAFKKRGKYLNH